MNIVLWTTISQMTDFLDVFSRSTKQRFWAGLLLGQLDIFFSFTKLDENVNDQEN